jgi:hypothetical protein
LGVDEMNMCFKNMDKKKGVVGSECLQIRGGDLVG